MSENTKLINFFYKAGKQNSKVQNSHQKIAKEEINQINLPIYEMDDDVNNYYQPAFDGDKIQLEGVENEIVFSSQGDNRIDYQDYHQQYNHQTIIESAKQYNNFNQQIYMSHPTAANTPYIDNNQIGLINNYDASRNQIYLDNTNNQYYTYQQNQIELSENIPAQENIYPNNQLLETFASPAPPQLQTAASGKQKKPRNSNSKSGQNAQENPKAASNTKKGKKGNNDKIQLEVIQENADYNDTNKIQEQEEQVQMDQLGNINILNKQDFSIANQYERSQDQHIDNTINLPIPQNQKRKSQSTQQQPKEQKNTLNVNLQASSNLMTIKLNKINLQQPLQQSQQNEQQIYHQNEQFEDKNKFLIQNIIHNSSNPALITNNQQIHSISQNNPHLHQNQQQQQQQQSQQQQQQQQQQNLMYNQQQNENNICNQELQTIDQQNQKYLAQQQQFLYNNQNQQYIQGHGIANQAYTFVSNEALGFENRHAEQDNYQKGEQEQQIYEQYNNQDQLDNQENIAGQNYQVADDIPVQTSQQSTGKKKYQKKNAKNAENSTEAPPKKQREKKQSNSDKSNTTTASSSTTTASILNQNQVELQSNYDNEKQIMNENFNQQNLQIEQENSKIQIANNLQDNQIQPSQENELLKQNSKQQKETKKRAPSKKKTKANQKIVEEQGQDEKQEEFPNQEQHDDGLINQHIETEQYMQITHQQNMFADSNLMENLQKKLANEQYKVDEMWNNKNIYMYQQPQNNLNQIYQHENLGLQQIEQNLIQNQGQQLNEQINMNNSIKYHNDQINQHQLQHLDSSSIKLAQKDSYSKGQTKQNKMKEVIDQDDDQMKQPSFGIELVPDQVNDFSQKPFKQIENEDDISNKQQSFTMPEKLTKKKSSKEQAKDSNRKRKAANSIISQVTNNSSNSEHDNQQFDDNIKNNINPIPPVPATITKEKSVNEKKRGIRDLTTEEKWNVFQQYDNLKSYRGVGRIFNMDHSTVKLLVNRIQNERPNEVITKEIFLQSQIAQLSSENSVSKKLKKEKQMQEAQQNANNQPQQKLQKSQSKSEKNKERQMSQENIAQEQENIKQEDQIQVYDNNQHQKTKEINNSFQNVENIQTSNVQDSLIKVDEKIEIAKEQQEQMPEPVLVKSKSRKESSRKSTNSKRRNSAVVKPQTEIVNSGNEALPQSNQMMSEQLNYQYDQQGNMIHNIHNDQMQLEQVQQNICSDKLNQDIKFEQEQYEGGNSHNYEIFQNMNQSENVINYQDQRMQDKSYLPIHQQQYNHQNLHLLQQNIYINDENKNGNHLNIQMPQQDLDQDLNQKPAPMSDLNVKSKSSVKMTAEEKKAKKEIKKQIQEQQKAQAKLDKPPKVKKGKGKGQQEQQVQIQEYRQEDQNYQQNIYDQNMQFNGYENQYIYQNFDPNMSYIQQNYQFPDYQNYQAKYEEDYDLNIENLEMNNQNHQQQQNNPQSYDNDEIKLELM
ncbi:hypothetical protein ABPG72_018066 [Tetrahymena utriculariae]